MIRRYPSTLGTHWVTLGQSDSQPNLPHRVVVRIEMERRIMYAALCSLEEKRQDINATNKYNE